VAVDMMKQLVLGTDPAADQHAGGLETRYSARAGRAGSAEHEDAGHAFTASASWRPFRDIRTAWLSRPEADRGSVDARLDARSRVRMGCTLWRSMC
jgi:hypothetical protein